MKRLMILGASYSLVPLIQAAKRLGYVTVAASIPGDYPGFSIADESCYGDITKPEEILKEARRFQVQGIATCCMDVGLKSQGYVASKLGLPGPSWETVWKCTNKYEMKKAFVENQVPTAPFCVIRSEEDLREGFGRLRFPLMLKAVDQMGSRGIFRCNTEEEVLAYYPETLKATKESYCILEEFLEGTMFGVEAMVQNGQLVYVLPVGNDLRQGNPPFPIGHYVPWQEGEALEEGIRSVIERAVRALGADNCPMDFDMMLKDGQVYVIEGTARAGATCLAELVGIHYGLDYYEVIAKLAMGEPVAELFHRDKKERVPNAVRLLETDQTGIVEEILPGSYPGGNLVDLSFNSKPGDWVQPMTNGRYRIGQAIVKGRTLEECRETMKAVMDRIQVKVKKDE